MMQKIYNWYGWYWRNNPPTEREKQNAKFQIVAIPCEQAQILHLIGNWDKYNGWEKLSRFQRNWKIILAQFGILFITITDN